MHWVSGDLDFLLSFGYQASASIALSSHSPHLYSPGAILGAKEGDAQQR